MQRLDTWKSRLRPATRGQSRYFWHIVLKYQALTYQTIES